MSIIHPDSIFKGDEEIGMLTKEKGGIMQEMMTDADTFNLEFPKDCPLNHKAVLLGAVFLVDFMFFGK